MAEDRRSPAYIEGTGEGGILQQLQALRQEEGITFFSPEYSREKYIDVEDGRIRIFHHTPPRPLSLRPLVFLPGWGTTPEGFADFFNIVDGRIECYYVETREKNSSVLSKSEARCDMEQKARDVREVLRKTGLLGSEDYILMGTSWGASVIAYGLAREIFQAPTVVLYDPMYRLWFPQWILRYLVPLTPDWMWSLVKPLAKRIALRGMREKRQRERAEAFIDGATVWKWRRCAYQVRGFELYDMAPDIQDEVYIVSGGEDKIHDQSHYPRLAARMPAGRFFQLPVHESQREYLLGYTALEFSKVRESQSPPGLFKEYEKKV